MVQSRSDSYLRPLCDQVAVEALRKILFHTQLNYSDKCLAIALLLEPGFHLTGNFKSPKLKHGLRARLARKFQVPESSISLWLKRIDARANIEFIL